MDYIYRNKLIFFFFKSYLKRASYNAYILLLYVEFIIENMHSTQALLECRDSLFEINSANSYNGFDAPAT